MASTTPHQDTAQPTLSLNDIKTQIIENLRIAHPALNSMNWAIVTTRFSVPVCSMTATDEEACEAVVLSGPYKTAILKSSAEKSEEMAIRTLLRASSTLVAGLIDTDMLKPTPLQSADGEAHGYVLRDILDA